MQILDLKFFVDFNLHFNKEINFGDRFILCKNVRTKTDKILRDHIWVNINNLVFTDPNCYYETVLGAYITGIANIEVNKKGKYIVNKFLVKSMRKHANVFELGFQEYYGIYVRELFREENKIFYTVITETNEAKIIEYYAGETKVRPESQKFKFSPYVDTYYVKCLESFEKALKLRIKDEIHTETIQALA